MSTEPDPSTPPPASTPSPDPATGATPPPDPATGVTPPPAETPPPPAGQPPGGKPSDKKLAAGILAILLGSLGIHKFYLGYQTEGIIMLVVGVVGWFLCGIPTAVVAIIGLVEGILYLTKTDEEFERTYLTGRKPWF